MRRVRPAAAGRPKKNQSTPSPKILERYIIRGSSRVLLRPSRRLPKIKVSIADVDYSVALEKEVGSQ
jgi:hypothetical protein